jgi:predicted nucleic acid-binding protein
VHSLAEVYAVMTALPVKPLIPPEQALLFVEEVRNRLTLVSLNGEDYFAAIERTAGRGSGGGRVYDALLLACAVKVEARTIYTWNLKHYQSLAPS